MTGMEFSREFNSLSGHKPKLKEIEMKKTKNFRSLMLAVIIQLQREAKEGKLK